MHKYELTVIVPATIAEEHRDKILAKLQELLTQNNAENINQDMWGRRTLAYPINKHTEGIYVLFTFDAPASVAQNIDYRVKINDDIIRHLLVKANS